jgi:hypothetical protein
MVFIFPHIGKYSIILFSAMLNIQGNEFGNIVIETVM